MLNQEITDIFQRAKSEIINAVSLQALDQIRVQYLGKKGELTELLKGVGKLTPEERPLAGQAVNKAKGEIQTLLNGRKETLEAEVLKQQLEHEAIDVTLPGRGQSIGNLHPITR